MKLWLSFALAGAVLLSGCSSILNRHVEYAEVKPEAFPLLRAVGYAPISAQLSSDKQ